MARSGGCRAPSSRALGASSALLPRAVFLASLAFLCCARRASGRGAAGSVAARCSSWHGRLSCRSPEPVSGGPSVRGAGPGQGSSPAAEVPLREPPERDSPPHANTSHLFFRGKRSKLNSKNGSRHLVSKKKKMVKMYLLLFNAIPAPSPATELLSDSHSCGTPLRAHSGSPSALGMPGRRTPPQWGPVPRDTIRLSHPHADGKSPLSSSACHATPRHQQRTPNSHSPRGHAA